MSKGSAADNVLASKVYRPPTFRDLVSRSHLLKQLDRGRERSMTLVCAPAGYGKSTLVSSWLESGGRLAAWLSLDEHDSDIETFLTGLVAALRTIVPGVCQETLTMLRAEVAPSPRDFASSLVKELSEIEENFDLVLDDYHVIHDIRVHDLLNELLRHPPRSLHLIVVSRRDPPLPLESYRARGELTEIRLEELRFSAEEAVRFLEQTAQTRIDSPVAAAINEKTEGWAAGLRLASLSLTDPGSVDRLVTELGGDSRYIHDYLMTEVLSHQSPAMRRMLLQTAVLERLCGPLCDTVCPPEFVSEAIGSSGAATESLLDGSGFLTGAERDNLFLIALDDRGEWYRFHHLFRDLLLHQLQRRSSPTEIAALHRAAARWFEENGHFEEAIHHYSSAQDPDAAAALVRRSRHELMNHEQWDRLDRLMNLLPKGSRSDTELMVQRAWNCENRYQYREFFRIVQEIEARGALVEQDPHDCDLLQSEIEVLRAIRYYVMGDGRKASALAIQALQQIPDDYLSQQGYAIGIAVMAYQMVGEARRAVTMALESLREKGTSSTTFHTRVHIALCHSSWMEADLTQLRRVAHELEAIGREANLDETVDFASYFLGIASYEIDDLEAARSSFARVAEQRYPSNTQNWIHSTIPLAFVLQAQGEQGRARELMSAAVAQALAAHNPDMIRLAQAGEAEVHLREGHLAEAKRWAEGFEPSTLPTRWRFFLPELTLVEVRLAEGTESSRKQARELLEFLHGHATCTNGRRSLVDILALKALFHDQGGDSESAFLALREAVELAEPSGLIRPFLDLGAPMGRLLSSLVKRSVSVAYLGKLVAAFRPASSVARSVAAGEAVSRETLEGISLDLEPLTQRESEILTLLARRLSDKEIAEQLFIAPGTVKKHLNNLYGKLNVHGRVEAVSKARDLRLL